MLVVKRESKAQFCQIWSDEAGIACLCCSPHEQAFLTLALDTPAARKISFWFLSENPKTQEQQQYVGML